jgi:hypothetical protein
MLHVPLLDVITLTIYLSLSLWFHSPSDLRRFFNFLILHIIGRTPWTGDQPVARPLPTHMFHITTDEHDRLFILCLCTDVLYENRLLRGSITFYLTTLLVYTLEMVRQQIKVVPVLN